MSRFRIGIVLNLLGSLALGALFGVVFHRLFLANVPQQWLSDVQSSASPFTFVGTGTRNLEDNGRRAIEGLFERSFGPPKRG